MEKGGTPARQRKTGPLLENSGGKPPRPVSQKKKTLVCFLWTWWIYAFSKEKKKHPIPKDSEEDSAIEY